MGAIVNVDRLPKPNLKKYRQMSEAELIATEQGNLPYGAFMPEGSKVFLAADAKVLAEVRGPLITATMLDDIKNLRQFLFVWGAALYKDGLGRPHKLRFCFFYNAKEDMFVACPVFNNTN